MTRTERFGTFSSSSNYKLVTFNRAGTGPGAPFFSYIKQVNHERRLGKPVNVEREARPTSWGKFIEPRVFNKLGLEYELVSNTRLFHPDFDCWSGMPDLRKGPGTVADVKCPYNLGVFCEKVEALRLVAAGDLETYKKEFPEDYWQHVSNAILADVYHAEAVIYCPFQAELEDIREEAFNYDAPDQWLYRWIATANDQDLPHLLNGGYYSDLNVVAFEIPQADKDFLTERVKLASKSLIPFHEVVNIDNLTY